MRETGLALEWLGEAVEKLGEAGSIACPPLRGRAQRRPRPPALCAHRGASSVKPGVLRWL